MILSILKNFKCGQVGFVQAFTQAPLNCPVLWSSKLQSEIALSTMEAKYISLSQAMRDLIPLQTILTEMCQTYGYKVEQAITHSTVFEDNKGCVELIAAPTMHPQSRHISIKYHHFHEHVRKGHIRIRWISTDLQIADIFTKLFDTY